MMGKLWSASEECGSGVLWALLVLSIAAILSGGLVEVSRLEHRSVVHFVKTEQQRFTAEGGIEMLAYRLEREQGLWNEIVQDAKGKKAWKWEIQGDDVSVIVQVVAREDHLCLLSKSHDGGRAVAIVHRNEAGKVKIHWGR